MMRARWKVRRNVRALSWFDGRGDLRSPAAFCDQASLANRAQVQISLEVISENTRVRERVVRAPAARDALLGGPQPLARLAQQLTHLV